MQNIFDPSGKDASYYRAQWLEFYQFRRNLLKRFVLGIVPFVLAIGAVEIVNTVFSDRDPKLANLLLLFGLASWVLAGCTIFATNWQLLTWACPRCGERLLPPDWDAKAGKLYLEIPLTADLSKDLLYTSSPPYGTGSNGLDRGQIAEEGIVVERTGPKLPLVEFERDPAKFIPAKPIDAPPGMPIGDDEW